MCVSWFVQWLREDYYLSLSNYSNIQYASWHEFVNLYWSLSSHAFVVILVWKSKLVYKQFRQRRNTAIMKLCWNSRYQTPRLKISYRSIRRNLVEPTHCYPKNFVRLLNTCILFHLKMKESKPSFWKIYITTKRANVAFSRLPYPSPNLQCSVSIMPTWR